MGLYDNYNAVNSQEIPRYQGSTVPELAAVAQKNQQDWDQSQNNMDYMSQFLNSMQAIPGTDQTALNTIKQKYLDTVKDLSKKPDLENAVRQTTMLARQLPQDYAPFANAIQQRQLHHEEIDKLDPDKYTLEDKNNAKALSDARYQGLSMGPDGKYIGNYTSTAYHPAPTLNTRTWTDNVMKDKYGVDSKTLSDAFAGVPNEDEKVLVQTTHGAKYLSQNDIKATLSTAMDVDPLIKQDMSQKQLYDQYLGTKGDISGIVHNYSVTPPGMLNRPGGDPVNNHSSINDNAYAIPSLATLIQHARDTHQDPKQLYEQLKTAKLQSDYKENIFNYGENKFYKNDTDNEQIYKKLPWRTEQDKSGMSIPISNDIIQPLPNQNFSNPKEAESKAEELRQAAVNAATDNRAWETLNGVKVPSNPDDPNAKWVDKNGVDVTSTARENLAKINAINTTRKQIGNIITDAKVKSGFNTIPKEDLDKAQKAYDDAYAITTAPHGMDDNISYTDYVYTTQDRIANAKAAYENSIKGSVPYKRYKDVFATNMQNQAVHTGVQRFSESTINGKEDVEGKNLNKAVEEQFNGTSTNLDPNGSKYGVAGLQWASGPNAGQPMSDGDYKKVIGNGKYVGHSNLPESDGKVYDYFNVGVDKSDKSGNLMQTPIIVKKPAYDGVVANMLKRGEMNTAHLYISKQLEQLNTNYGAPVTIPTLKGTVIVRPVTQTDRDQNYQSKNANYIISIKSKDGKIQEHPVNNLQEASTNILENLRQ